MRRREFRHEPWSRRAATRRSLFLLLILAPTLISSGYMADGCGCRTRGT